MTAKKSNKKTAIIRSSAAEYLTFIAASGESGVDVVYADENIWLSQKMMGMLYNVETHTVNYHLKKIFSDNELDENSVIRKFRITAQDGKQYQTNHYNLSAVIAVGYKVNSERAVLFRKWATQIVQEFTIKGFAMDDERLKNDGTILGKKYFEEQLQRIREIRLSERKFYQKITDIYSTAIDYDVTATATKRFFATVQNKLHWAIHGSTAAELIVNRGEDWETRLNRFIAATDREILQDAGKVTAEIAKAHAETEFEKYRIIQDRLFESDFDRMVKKQLPPNKK